MPYLASFVPPHWTVLHVDEGVESVDFDTRADLVAITFHTPSTPHAYDLAAADNVGSRWRWAARM